jgi:hypothetical protein
VILLIKLPRTGSVRLHDALNAALGESAVGWLGRNVSRRDIRAGLRDRNFRILVGPVDLADTRHLPEVSLFTTFLPDPQAIPVAEWAAARNKADHPHHTIAHTLALDEVLAEEHPFARQLFNVATRTLTPRGETMSARTALATIERRPFLVGFSSHAEAYARALTRALGLAPATLDARLFETATPSPAHADSARAVKRASAMDRTLHDTLLNRLDPESGVYRTTAGCDHDVLRSSPSGG